MELAYVEKQIVLYSKGHFGSRSKEKASDLLSFASKHYNIPEEYIETSNILNMVSRLYLKLSNHGFLNADFLNMIGECFKKSKARGERCITHFDIIDFMLSEISMIDVTMKGAFDIGEPNHKLLKH